MTNDDKKVLATMLANLQEQATSLLIFLKNHSSEDGEAAVPAESPAKEYTYEEARTILAEKARSGHRAEVKAILTRHGVTQLSDVRDPKTLATLVAEAEAIGDG